MMGKLEGKFLKFASVCSKAADVCGVYTLIREINKDKVTILMYHGITAYADSILNFDYKHVEREKFEEQLQYLKKHYSLIALEEFIKWKEGKKKLLKNPLMLTFDDGYANCYTQLFLLLKKYNAPAVIFLPTTYISKKGIAWYDVVAYCIAATKKSTISITNKTYPLVSDEQKKAAIVAIKEKCYNCPEERERILKEVVKETEVKPEDCATDDMGFMSWEQCQEMQKAGIVFGSHSMTHPIMIELSKEEINKEVLESKKSIEKKLKMQCYAFAYPFGKYNNEVEVQLQKAGYLLGFTVEYGKNTKQTPDMRIKRIAVNNLYELPLFALNLCFPFTKFHHWVMVQYQSIKNALF